MNSQSSVFHVRRAFWLVDEKRLCSIRRKVFIEEQHVPEELEWGSEDMDALHLLAVDAEENPVGTARLLATGQIGRMAVLPDWRGRGVGSAMLGYLLAHIELEMLPAPFLHAQLSAVGFYRKLGFVEEGEVFMDAGIAHRAMRFVGNSSASAES